MTDMKTMQRLTTYVNASLMGFVFFAMFFYAHYGVTYMVYHSIPTLACYVVFFIMIRKGLLYQYAGAVYTVITIYMVAGTVCLGYSAGFHLYCISLIPLAFYMVYLAQKLNLQKANPVFISFALIMIYVISTVYVVLNGPVYTVAPSVLCGLLVLNSVAVFCFLAGYAGFMIQLVTDSESKLTDMANTDRLTQLANRNYLMNKLSDPQREFSPDQWLAIADIDDFKAINDTYGHSCGDHVLVQVADTMRTVCQGCTICRWGGEEFLILSDTASVPATVAEQLRRAVEAIPFSYQGQSFTVTITVGVSNYQPGRPLDGWVRDADHKLYVGKAANKNRVIY